MPTTAKNNITKAIIDTRIPHKQPTDFLDFSFIVCYIVRGNSIPVSNLRLQ
jgi:hypothetical protein